MSFKNFSSMGIPNAFAADPGAYAPRFGGFCSFGITAESTTEARMGMDVADPSVGWMWSRDYLGPPADPASWAIVEGQLYFTFLPEVMDAFLDAFDDLAPVGEAAWTAWFGDSGATLQNGPFNTECTAAGYGPPVTRTCTWIPQKNLGTEEPFADQLSDECNSALLTKCGGAQGNDPVADNACSSCLLANAAALADAGCPSSDSAVATAVDKAFCW